MSWLASGSESRRRGRFLAFLLLLLATAGVAWAIVPRDLASRVSLSLIPPDDPDVRLDAEIESEFGMENPIVWIVEARSGTVWTPPMLERIATLTRETFTIPGVIATDVVSLASPNLRDLRLTDDGLEPVYLMDEVPTRRETLDALRERVDHDPNYAGTLTTLDGRAAMVVANFTNDVDSREVGQAALALRDRFRDGQADVHVVGAPVLLIAARGVLRALALPAAISLLAMVALPALALGIRRWATVLLASLLACVWMALAVVAAGIAVLPWMAFAMPATVALAAITAARCTVPGARARSYALPAAALLAGSAACALVAGPPAAALGFAGVAGALCALAAGVAAAGIVNGQPAVRAPQGGPVRRRRVLACALIAGGIAIAGVARLRVSLPLAGYGVRYLPAAATTDLRALARLFPPPTMLAIRARGESGFVADPEVLTAMDALGAAAGADPAVRQTQSLADVVKLVNRAFHEGRPEFATIPDDRGLNARYLTLAYSPGFRRFVDRALDRTILWVQVASDRAADLARVRARLEAQLRARPLPGAEVDLMGGDGAVVLVMARQARRLALGGCALALMLALGAAIAAGWRSGLRTVLVGVLAAAVGAGLLGWLGFAIDLISLPGLVALTAVAELVAFGRSPVKP